MFEPVCRVLYAISGVCLIPVIDDKCHNIISRGLQLAYTIEL